MSARCRWRHAATALFMLLSAGTGCGGENAPFLGERPDEESDGGDRVRGDAGDDAGYGRPNIDAASVLGGTGGDGGSGGTGGSGGSGGEGIDAGGPGGIDGGAGTGGAVTPDGGEDSGPLTLPVSEAVIEHPRPTLSACVPLHRGEGRAPGVFAGDGEWLAFYTEGTEYSSPLNVRAKLFATPTSNTSIRG